MPADPQKVKEFIENSGAEATPTFIAFVENLPIVQESNTPEIINTEPNSYNFDNCKYRSKTQIDYLKPCNCATKEIRRGWYCHYLNMGTSVAQCSICDKFQPKNQ